MTIAFDYDGEVSLQDTVGILEQAQELHQRVLGACEHAKSEQRRIALNVFAAGLARTFYNFEPDFFQQNLSRIVDDEIGIIRSSLELWPTLLEIVYYKRHCHSLPMRRVKNQERAVSKAATIPRVAVKAAQ